ncbi:MAG: hypothetical protein ACRBCI_12260 [Cellvibrionaceae bacterium]
MKSISVILLILLFTVSHTVNAQQWEYQVKTIGLLGDDVITRKLNKSGEQGWELVNCTVEKASLTCIFKRAE